MPDHDPSSQPTGGGGPAPLLDRAASIFLDLKPLGLAEREEAISRACGTDAALRAMVMLLLRGDKAPLRVESLADDIRSAQETIDLPAMAEARGSTIGRYRLLERLGEGGFGVVFAAEQTEPVKRRVALKLIKLGMDTREVIARFEAERQALAMMDHPNIAKVFDAGATETGRPYFVMELVRGVPITDYCDARRLSVAARLGLFAQVCDAIQHAHQKGVIHRDIKPSNVLVTEAGEQSIPKVIDFGIAKATSARLTEKTVFTEMRQMIGTPEYMSPEQADVSALDIDTRTDVYSLGVLLYELLSGSTPFDGRRLRSAGYGEIQRIIREEDPPRPSTKLTTSATRNGIAEARGIDPARLGTVLRGELDWVVMKCLEKDRGRRYDSAGSLMRDVQRFLAGSAVQAVPPSVAYRARKFVRRNRGPVIAGALLSLVLVVGLIGTGLGYINAQSQRRLAVAERDRAEDERRRADTKAAEALAAEARASRGAYSANMLSAGAAMATNQLTSARAFLDAAPEALRGWEWRTLSSRLDTSVRAIACPMPDWKPGEPQWANDLIPHPDGRSFFTVRRFAIDAAHRWDLATGALIARYSRPLSSSPDMHTGSYFLISPDATRLWAYSGTTEGVPVCAVSAWDLGTNARVFHAELPPVGEADGIISITPDGSRIARNRGERMWLHDVATGAVLAEGHGYGMGGFKTVSADGALLAASGNRGTIQIYDTRTLALVAELTGHTNIVFGLAFSHDNRWLGSAAIDNTARVWDLGASPPTSIVMQHSVAVEYVRLSPDASLVATIARDQAIRVWDARSGELRGTYTSGDLIAGVVMFMPDGRTVAGRERDGTVRFWDVTAETTVNLAGHKGLLNGACFAPATGLIVSAGWDGWKGSPGCVRFWDAQTGDEVASIGVPGEVAYLLAVSPEGTHAAASIIKTETPWTPKELTRQQRIEIIDLTTGRTTRVPGGPLSINPFKHASSLSFDPGGTQLAVGAEDRLDIRSAASGEILRSRVSGFEAKQLRHVSWSPDGRTIACLTREHGGQVIGDLGSIVILDAQTLETIRTLDGGAVSSLAFSPDGTQLCAGSYDGRVRFFDAQTGELLRTLAAHDQVVNGIAFNPDATRLATVGGEEGDIVVWNTATWDRVARFHEDGHVSGAAWDETGARLIGACERTVRVWDPTPLRERVEARDQRRAAMVRLEPLVASLFDALREPRKVAERIDADPGLSSLERRIATQAIFARSLARDRQAPTPSPD